MRTHRGPIFPVKVLRIMPCVTGKAEARDNATTLRTLFHSKGNQAAAQRATRRCFCSLNTRSPSRTNLAFPGNNKGIWLRVEEKIDGSGSDNDGQK